MWGANISWNPSFLFFWRVMLDHMVILCLVFFEEPQNCFPQLLPHFYNPISNARGFQFLLTHILILAILVGMKWYLIVGLICISHKTNDKFLFIRLILTPGGVSCHYPPLNFKKKKNFLSFSFLLPILFRLLRLRW